jgi:hypothetical protein
MTLTMEAVCSSETSVDFTEFHGVATPQDQSPRYLLSFLNFRNQENEWNYLKAEYRKEVCLKNFTQE